MWLEINKPDLRQDSAATQAIFATGHQVGEIAQRLYDPSGEGLLIDLHALGVKGALEQTAKLTGTRQPVFEAGFSAKGAMAFADVLLPVTARHASNAWRMVEVKSSTSVKPYYRDDIAIQAYVARASGLDLIGVAVAHIDTSFVYEGGGKYEGFLAEVDLTAEAFSRTDEVSEWIASAQSTAAKRQEPAMATGAHCSSPFSCGFLAHCSAQEISGSSSSLAEFPVQWLPRLQSAGLKAQVTANPNQDMRDVPDSQLNALQLRVKKHTLSGAAFFDEAEAQKALAEKFALDLPVYFLDFETQSSAVPAWAGMHPFEKSVFQFSVHHISMDAELTHCSFLDVSGNDPGVNLVEQLLAACDEQGAVMVYNQSFESSVIGALAQRYPVHSPALLALQQRLVDLLPITRKHYYHPDQHGSWSLKQVLPTLAGGEKLNHTELAGVQTSSDAPLAYLEATSSATTAERKAQIELQLLAYCRLDTLATVRLWAMLAGRADLMNLKEKKMNKNIEQIFDNLDTWRHLPNYQLERRADIFFSLYLKEVLEKKFECVLCDELIPEFPLRIGTLDGNESNQSKKVDYVAITKDHRTAYLIELKTENSSLGKEQIQYLEKAQSTVGSFQILLNAIPQIRKGSNTKPKYDRLDDLIKSLKRPADNDSPSLNFISEIIIVYVVPKADVVESLIKESDLNVKSFVIDFKSFGETVHLYDDSLSKRFADSLKEWAEKKAGSPRT